MAKKLLFDFKNIEINGICKVCLQLFWRMERRIGETMSVDSCSLWTGVQRARQCY